MAGSYAISGVNQVGGLVGTNDGGTISYAHVEANVQGDQDIGGLVGLNTNLGFIKSSLATGETYGNVSDSGGLVGHNIESRIENSYATGDVYGLANVGGLVGGTEGGNISKTYSTGVVNGALDYGALIGKTAAGPTTSSQPVVAASFANTDAWGDPSTWGPWTSAAGIGKTTSELSSISTFSGWSIVSDSNLPSSYAYPVLTMTGSSPTWKIYPAGGSSSGGSSSGGSSSGGSNSGGSNSGGSSSGGSSSGGGSSGGSSSGVTASEQAAKNSVQGELARPSNGRGDGSRDRHDVMTQSLPQPSSGTVLSGGLALIDNTATENSSSGSVAANDKDANERKKSGSGASAQNNSAGRDASGFMRVFVISGGIKLP